jgi:hypothetical protein
MGQKLQPAVLGGLLIGVLSALPFVVRSTRAAALWVLAGGLLTAYPAAGASTMPMTAGDAAMAGLLAGVIGAIVAGVLESSSWRSGGAAESLDQIRQATCARVPPGPGSVPGDAADVLVRRDAVAYLWCFRCSARSGRCSRRPLQAQPPPPRRDGGDSAA